MQENGRDGSESAMYWCGDHSRCGMLVAVGRCKVKRPVVSGTVTINKSPAPSGDAALWLCFTRILSKDAECFITLALP